MKNQKARHARKRRQKRAQDWKDRKLRNAEEAIFKMPRNVTVAPRGYGFALYLQLPDENGRLQHDTRLGGFSNEDAPYAALQAHRELGTLSLIHI